MPGRSYSNGTDYRYGFNGKEKDGEIEGQQDYGFRIYDSRLGRFKSIDPLSKSYPWLTPYQFASNRPIDGIDLDGKEWSVSRNGNTVTFTVKIAVFNESNTLSNVKQLQRLVNTLEAKIENNFTKSFKNSDGTTTNYVLDIQFDTKPAIPKDESKFKLILRDLEPKTTDEDKGTVTYAGGSTRLAIAGVNNASQENILYGTLSVKNATPSGDAMNVDYSTLIRNLTHEFGHSGGLAHVWDDLSPADINQKNMGYVIGQTLAAAVLRGATGKEIKGLRNQLTSFFSNLITSNLMDSEENPSEKLRTSNSGSTNLTQGQFQAVEQTVSAQQPTTKIEDEKK